MQVLCQAFRTQLWPPRFIEDEDDSIDVDAVDECFSLMEAYDIIKTLGKVELKKKTCSDTGRKTEVTKEEFTGFAEDVLDICSGLCLSCVKEGKADLMAKCKKSEHEETW